MRHFSLFFNILKNNPDSISNNDLIYYLKCNSNNQYLDENKSHIWSSSTLYDELTRREREEWFYDFLNKKNKEVNSDDIIDFHISTRKEDTENGLIISRSNNILTKNVTQTILYPTHFAMKHWDLTKNEKTAIEKPFQ